VSAIAAPADRRFRRSHIKPSRGRRRWGRIKSLLRYGVALLALAYGAYLLSGSVARADILRINHVVVHGNERMSQADVVALIGGLHGESIVWADLAQWRERLLTSPWIRDAALRRSLPSTIDVVVSERQPVALGRFRDGMYLVDERGAIVDRYGPQYADLDLPIVDGLDGPVSKAGGPASQTPPVTDGARAELAARVIAAIKTRPDVAHRLSQVDVRDVHNAQIILTGEAAVISLGDDQFLERLQNYLDLAPALHNRVTEIDHVDVRFDNRIYVRPKKR
jgi:cell division protein FtsQ